MSKNKKTVYQEEFKQSAVKLALESNRPYAETARGLGIMGKLLYSWIAQANGKSTKTPAAAAIVRFSNSMALCKV